MAKTSIRGILTYASQLFTQIPIQLSDFPNPLSIISTANTPAEVPTFNNVPAAVTPYNPLTGAPSCPVDGPLSCHNQTSTDSCCFIYPGGRLLQTQFWDEEVHVEGAEQDWTAHGLWPDLCDGTYDQYCGMAPHFNNITDILHYYGQDELLALMNRYWVPNYGSHEHFWQHEYNKHATCINTLSPSCYGDSYTPGLEVVDFFVRAFGLFKTLDTYRALEQAGIEPDKHKKFSLAKIQDTLDEFSGGRVILKCSGRHHDVLNEAWYVYFVQGSLQSGQFVPAQDTFQGGESNCANEVRYLPKKKKRHH